jgi:hypothetical protein
MRAASDTPEIALLAAALRDIGHPVEAQEIEGWTEEEWNNCENSYVSRVAVEGMTCPSEVLRRLFLWVSCETPTDGLGWVDLFDKLQKKEQNEPRINP